MPRRKIQKKKPKKHTTLTRQSAKTTSSPGPWFEKLVALQARLRSPNGCPWDREQTHSSLRTYLIEEAYEVLDALEGGDDVKFAEELGDLLLQIVFHAQIATEEGRFTIADVIREIHEKMVRRHPHVFGEKRAKDAAEVVKNWEQIKAEERRIRGTAAPKLKQASASGEANAAESLMSGVPRGLPAALEGFQLTRRAARIGFDWDDVAGIFEKIEEEGAELRRALQEKNQRRIEEEVGDLLFSAINLARFVQVDPEIALKKANAKFIERFRTMENLASQSGRKLADVPREEMESLWDIAKRNGKGSAAPQAAEASARK